MRLVDIASVYFEKVEAGSKLKILIMYQRGIVIIARRVILGRRPEKGCGGFR